MSRIKIQSALISVYYKDNLDEIVRLLSEQGVTLYSTGGTRLFIEKLGIPVIDVEEITGYPEILGGRVKTLHPAIFGGILARRDETLDEQQLIDFKIPPIDLVIVDLYPFEETLSSGAAHQQIIEKIDIGGISLIRAAAKNYHDVVIVSSRSQYNQLLTLLKEKAAYTDIEDRKQFALAGFQLSSHYDTRIYSYFAGSDDKAFKQSIIDFETLRYGENPHQTGIFHGNLNELFDQLHGKEISYNNLLDIDAAVHLMMEFEEPSFAILKHTNPCGLASRQNVKEAYLAALAGDPISAFGGVLICNQTIDTQAAEEINKLFFEVIIAPGYDATALDYLKQKKNRIILVLKHTNLPVRQFRSLLNGVLSQDKDFRTEEVENLSLVSNTELDSIQIDDLLFANKIVKHTKSNAIVIAKNKQLIAGGIGQTSRVDALRQAIEKALSFEFDLEGAALASDAFFPFADSVEIAHQYGISAIIQPGGSVRDQESIDFCNAHNMSMVFTGTRHFKH